MAGDSQAHGAGTQKGEGGDQMANPIKKAITKSRNNISFRLSFFLSTTIALTR